MNQKILILGLFITCFEHLICSSSTGNCPIVDLTNGNVKYAGGGRVVRFSCNKPLTLVGSSSAVCHHGEWNHPPPFCSWTSCPLLGRILHGSVTITYRGAVANPTCDPDFDLIGSPLLLCTEEGWNDTLPICQAKSLLQFGTCHFEPPEITQCNWILRPALFKWHITSSNQHNSSDQEFYPTVDHTLAPHAGGHYLYLENTMPVSSVSLRLEHRPDNGAKFISPLFPPVDGNEKWCLIFFIYSFGSNAGNVEVMINNDTVWKITELMRRNMWTKVTISLTNHQRSPFRITIIGKGHLGHFSNTAIDDLRIAHGTECGDTNDVLSSSVEPAFDEDDVTTTEEIQETHEIYKRETTTDVSSISTTAFANRSTFVESTNLIHVVTFSTILETTTQGSSTDTLFMPITSTISSSSASHFSSSSVVTSVNGIKLLAQETSTAVNENEEPQMKNFASTTNVMYQTKVAMTMNTADSPHPNHTTDNLALFTGRPKKPDILTGWTDFEKLMVYIALVIASTVVLIVALIIIRYRNYHTLKINNDNNMARNNENIAFLNEVELIEKY